MEMSIYYEGFDIGTRRVDFFVEDNIMAELKALIKLEDVHLAQAMNYQRYNLPIGLLINFGSKSPEFKRVYNVNHTENRAYKSELGLEGLKDDRIDTSSQTELLKSINPKNPNSDK